MIFTNTSPDSEEWTAFIELLNKGRDINETI